MRAKKGVGVVAKTIAREHGKTVRAGLTTSERAAKSALILERLRNELDWEKFQRVHLFLPIERLNEVDTWPLLTWIWKSYPETRTYVPRLASSSVEHVRVKPETHFGPNAMGIPEPMSGKVIGEHSRLDLVLAPLLAFDRRGHRVGYGGGHYDRFLAHHPEALRVGVAFAACEVPEGIADEAHDVPLHQIATEQAMLGPFE